MASSVFSSAAPLHTCGTSSSPRLPPPPSTTIPFSSVVSTKSCHLLAPLRFRNGAPPAISIFNDSTVPNYLNSTRIREPARGSGCDARFRASSNSTNPSLAQVGNKEDDNLDEDAFDALFAQLENDLQNDNGSLDSDDEVNEEDLAMLEKELAAALGDEDYDESIDTDYNEPEERHPKLKNWQLRRLAAALKMGRRKTKIKSLATELGLDRAFVLELLRDPPSSLLMLSAALPAKIEHHTETIEAEVVESPPTPVSGPVKIGSQPKAPTHIMQSRMSAKKRLKKVQVEVLERVYYRTKRPTNAMISSIIEVTNLPWKRVIEWFEDKRIRDGIPKKRVPFRR